MLPFLYFTNAISITLFRNRHKRKHRNITNFAARWGRCQLGHKDGHQGFHPCESRFLYFLVWRRPETGDRFEKEERQRIFPLIRTDLLRVRPFLLPIRSSVTLLLHISATLRRRDMPVSRNSLAWKLPTAPAKINCAKQTDSQVPSGITRSNVARHCHPPGGPSLALRAIHLVPRLRRAADMCSSTLSANCEYFTKDTLW